jgi:hypothetical protein
MAPPQWGQHGRRNGGRLCSSGQPPEGRAPSQPEETGIGGQPAPPQQRKARPGNDDKSWDAWPRAQARKPRARTSPPEAEKIESGGGTPNKTPNDPTDDTNVEAWSTGQTKYIMGRHIMTPSGRDRLPTTKQAGKEVREDVSQHVGTCGIRTQGGGVGKRGKAIPNCRCSERGAAA